jgi:hypothetical protein
MAEMVDFLTRFYGISEATAREVIAEMRDTTSLRTIASGYRIAPRADTPKRV